MIKKASQHSCVEYRKLAHNCYYMQEDEFVDHILDKYEQRRRFADFLEKEGSMFAQSTR